MSYQCGNVCPCLITTLVREIWEDSNNFNRTIFRHSNGKCNQVTDYLAKSAYHIEQERDCIVKFPPGIIQLAPQNLNVL